MISEFSIQVKVYVFAILALNINMARADTAPIQSDTVTKTVVQTQSTKYPFADYASVFWRV
jgi:hypothetical protein